MKILLHTCCSNCTLYPVKLLKSDGHSYAGFWFNPNIHPLEEYNLRLESVKRLETIWNIDMIYADEYGPKEYFRALNIKPEDVMVHTGLYNSNSSSHLMGRDMPAPSERCRSCYLLRLEKTAFKAREQGFDAFTTTLLISPYQDFENINQTGIKLAERYNVEFYIRDFRPHFRDAMSLSKELGLYRQKYCGCIFSKEEREKIKNKR